MRARHELLTSLVVERADEMGLRIASPREAQARGGMVRVLLEDSQRVFRALLERNVVVDERAGGIRIAPHFFTAPEEIDACFDALGSLGAHS